METYLERWGGIFDEVVKFGYGYLLNDRPDGMTWVNAQEIKQKNIKNLWNREPYQHEQRLIVCLDFTDARYKQELEHVEANLRKLLATQRELLATQRELLATQRELLPTQDAYERIEHAKKWLPS